MIVEQPGNVTDRILLLGSRESCVYLLKGEGEYALLGGGMVSVVPELDRQIENFGIDVEKIRRIVVQHTHFDHCGVVPYFKRKWPWATVTASSRARDLLAKPKVIESIAFLNQVLLARYGLEKTGEKLGLKFSGIDVEDPVKDGDTLACGDLSLEILEVPGHSSCSIAVYVPEEKAMFTSDSGGIPFGDKVFTAANSNFDRYMESLEKMAAYDIEVLLPEHYGARTGPDARHFMEKASQSAVEMRSILEGSYARTRDVGRSTDEIVDRLLAENPGSFIPREIVSLVVGQMLNYIARQQES